MTVVLSHFVNLIRRGDYHFQELVYHFREKKFSLPGIFVYLFRDFLHVKFEVGYIISGRNKL
jgi:hypothetical protein